ncbi:hypothetical protein AMTRI_Chr12g270600 [Amborella trichopoda]
MKISDSHGECSESYQTSTIIDKGFGDLGSFVSFPTVVWDKFFKFLMERVSGGPSTTSLNARFVIHGKEMHINLQNVPPHSEAVKTSLCNLKLDSDAETHILLRGFEPLIQKKLIQSTNISGFLSDLKMMLEYIVKVKCKETSRSSSFHRFIFSEFKTDHCPLNVSDTMNHEHIVEITLPPEYPECAPSVLVDVPYVCELRWSKQSSLKEALHQLREHLKIFQDLWSTIDEIDKELWVIQSGRSKRCSSSVQLALGNDCFMLLFIDVGNPTSLPECRFLGPDSIVNRLKLMWERNTRKWRSDVSYRENLENILEIKVPGPPRDVTHEAAVDCGICYAHFLPEDDELGAKRGSVPDYTCDNLSCSRTFHSICLIDWLRSITTTRQSFDVLFGNCPYCSGPVAIKWSMLE